MPLITVQHRSTCGVNARPTGHRENAQASRHQPLVHALSCTFKRLSTHHQVKIGSPYNVNRDLRKDIVIERGGLRSATYLAGVPQQSNHLRVRVRRPTSGGSCTRRAELIDMN